MLPDYVTPLTMPQRSPEWYQARRACATASKADVIASPTLKSGGVPAAYRDYVLQCALEEFLSAPVENDLFISAEMQRGIDLEPQARQAYEAWSGNMVLESGFLRDTRRPVGCSLDGYVGPYQGVVEIKCPKSATAIRYWRDGLVPADYRPQMLHQMLVSGAQWADFVSYDPRLGPELALFVVRFPRDEKLIADYNEKLEQFLRHVAEEVAGLRQLAAQRRA